jgi:hypothetical protein
MASKPTYQGTDLNRRFQTKADRYANQTRASGQQRQRSFSFHDTYSDGSVERRHVHNNIQTGEQFEHVIGGWNPDGTQWGRVD